MRFPFPKLEKLEVLSLRGVGTEIGSELVRKNCHVTHLKIWNMDKADEDIENYVELPNLQGFSANDSRSANRIFKNLGGNWKTLNKLRLGHMFRFRSGARKLFEILETNWAESLTDFHLEHPFGLDEETILEQSKKLRLNLSAVRKLRLCLFRPVFLDFALPLEKSLEHLQFQLLLNDRQFSKKYMERVKSEQEIEFAGFEDPSKRTS